MCRAETKQMRERRLTRRSIVARVASGALAAVIACAAAGAAQAEDAATRKLESVWKTAVPGDSKVGVFFGLRLRVQDDNRISLAAGYALVTLDAAGKILHRVVLPIRKNEEYASVPLQGGDFLVQPNAAATGQMRLSRVSAEGRTRFANVEKLPGEILGILHDALLLPDGRILAAASYGPGPNAVLALLVFDAAGRRVADHRTTIFLPASEGMTRLYAQFNDRELSGISVIGMGSRPNGSGPFQKIFTFMGEVPVAPEADFFGAGYLKCSAMNAGGSLLLGISDPKGDNKRVTLRWLRYPGQEPETRDLEEADSCQIALRRDGSSLVWLAPRKLFAFDEDAKLLWRAEFAEDAVAVGWMSDGDIVAVHPSGAGANVVRYLAH
jgi:hypothetical protein